MPTRRRRAPGARDHRAAIRNEGRIGGVADRDQDIPHKAIPTRTLYRRFREQLSKAGIVQADEIEKARSSELRMHRKLCVAARLGEFVPGTDREAIVAAVDAVADGVA
jgi:hypothetical protein